VDEFCASGLVLPSSSDVRTDVGTDVGQDGGLWNDLRLVGEDFPERFAVVCSQAWMNIGFLGACEQRSTGMSTPQTRMSALHRVGGFWIVGKLLSRGGWRSGLLSVVKPYPVRLAIQLQPIHGHVSEILAG
jgi:hypothetical protein